VPEALNTAFAELLVLLSLVREQYRPKRLSGQLADQFNF
jgi:hypothetical protein